MHDLNDLYYFVHVVEHAGFAAASRALGVPKSKLSRRIAQLEQQLGVRLLQRSTRQFSVTAAGQRLLVHAKAMLLEADAAFETIAQAQSVPRGRLRMTCPDSLVDGLVGKVVVDYMRRYPDVEVHLEASGRSVDVIGEGIDLAVRVRPLPLQDSDLVVKPLAQVQHHLVASPNLLARLGAPKTPENLAAYPSLALGLGPQNYRWELHGEAGKQAIVQHQPRLVSRNFSVLCEAAVAGLGIVELPQLISAPFIAQGLLQVVLPQWHCGQYMIHLVYASRRGQLPAMRELIAQLTRAYATNAI